MDLLALYDFFILHYGLIFLDPRSLTARLSLLHSPSATPIVTTHRTVESASTADKSHSTEQQENHQTGY
jgi:hypothetical protein